MIDIAKKKPPLPVLSLILYVSYCAAMWFVSRGNLAYYAESYALSAMLGNDVVAFLIGGLVPTLVFVLVSSAIQRNITLRVRGDIPALRCGIYYAVSAANIVLFLLKLTYMAAPLYAPVIDIILDPVVTVLFVGLYMIYAFRMNYVEKNKFGYVLSQVLGTMSMIYALLALVSLVLSAV